jgi:hypothetical protein
LRQSQSDDGLWRADVRTTALAYLAFARTDAMYLQAFRLTMLNAGIALVATDDPDPVRALALVVAADNPYSTVMIASAQAAVDALLANQRPDGAWGDDETTGWALIALAESILADFSVPAAAPRRALAYVDDRTTLFSRPDEFLAASATLVRLLDRQRMDPPRAGASHGTRYIATRALALVDRAAAGVLRRQVAAAQLPGGSWDHDVAATALAALTLTIR